MDLDFYEMLKKFELIFREENDRSDQFIFE